MLTAFELLARSRDRLTRDVILLGTAGEEGGDVGIEWLVANHPELLDDVEFALNEGGRVRIRNDVIHTVNIQTTEKVSYNVRAEARGPSGHGSVPLRENALAALARAVARIHDWAPPFHVNETTRSYFGRLAQIEEDMDLRAAMREIATSTNERTIRRAAETLSRNPLHNAVLRTGASLTMVQGGIRSNVIPSDGWANFNVRILPGEDIRGVVREMNFVGEEEGVVFELVGEPKDDPPPSPVTTALYRAMERSAIVMEPRATVIPFMSTGATDGAALRAIGIPTYGLLPLPLTMEDELRLHGDNERVPVGALAWGVEYIYRVLLAVMQ